MRLEKAEQKILQALQIDGRMSNVALSEKIGLSESPCFRRVRGLEDAGVISGYGAKLNRRAIGLQITAFIQITIDKQDEKKKCDFQSSVQEEEHIVECHTMSGRHDYLLKVVARSMDHFSKVLLQNILNFPGVRNIESNFSLLAVKEEGELPVYRND